MTIIKSLIILFFISALISGCALTYGDETQSSFVKFGDAHCGEKSDNVYLFFEGEKVDFEYQKIGLVEVNGNENADKGKLLTYLKYEAWDNCANAIIGIQDNNQIRFKGRIGDNTSTREYNSKVFNGIAVKIKIDSNFISKNLVTKDTSFVTEVRREREKNSNILDAQVGFSYFIAIFAVTLAIIILAISRKGK